MSPELEEALRQAREMVDAMAPEQYKAMIDAQRESFIRAMAPCEHGELDFEQCGECRA